MRKLQTSSICFKSFSIMYGVFQEDFPGHSHARNNYELHYVTEGLGKLITYEKNYKLQKNILYITGPGKYHMQKTSHDNNMKEFCLYFELESPADDLFFNIFRDRNFWIGRCSKNIKKLFLQIYELNQKDSLYHDLQINYLLCLLILELTKIYEPQVLNLKSQNYEYLSEDALNIDWIFLSAYSNLTLQSLADSLGLSTRQTQRILMTNYGQTFQQKKNEARLEHAKILLSDKTLTIQQIAEACGFYGGAAFCNFFKKYTGITPTDYRKNILFI